MSPAVKSENLDYKQILSSVDALSEELELYGVQSLPKYQSLEGKLESDTDKMAFILNAVTKAAFSFMQYHRSVLHEHEEADERKQRLIDDSHALRVAKNRLEQLLSEREHALKLLAEEKRQLNEKYNASCQALKAEREEVRRLRIQLKNKEQQHTKEVRRKEQKVASLEIQLNQALSSGSLKKTGKRLPTEDELRMHKLTEAKEAAYKRVINQLEDSTDTLMKENLSVASMCYRLTTELALIVDGFNGLMRVCFKNVETGDSSKKEKEHSYKDHYKLSVTECQSQACEYVGILNHILDVLKERLAYGEGSESKQEA